MKNTKRLKNAFLLIFFLLILPIFSIFASDDLLLSSYDANYILGNLPKIFTDEWMSSIIEAKSGKEQAAIVILKKAAQQNKLNYLLEQAPKEVVKEIARISWQAYSMGSGTELSEIIGSFEKETVKESVNYVLKILKEQQIKISFGNFDVEYETINEDMVKSGLQYIMIYKPVTETRGEVILRIYSANALTPPKSKGDPWSAAINYTWFSDSEIEKSKKVPPFICEISGSIDRKKAGYFQKEIIHEYKFSTSTSVNIAFPETVPTFEFPKEGWLGKVLNSVKEKLDGVLSIFGANLVKEEDIFTGVASTTEENTDNFNEELNKRIEALEKKYNQTNPNNQATKSEIEQLRKEMTNLFKQFAFNNDSKDVEEGTSSTSSLAQEIATSTVSVPKLLISEVCAGMDNAKSEFIEIFNPNNYAVTINDNNFSLWIVDSKDKPTEKRITWMRNQIPPFGYFLFAGSDLYFSGLKFDVDAYYSNQITSIGGVIISQQSGEDLDRVGWGKPDFLPPDSSIEGEGKILDSGLASKESLGRKRFGQGLVDTDNNKEDFEISHFPNPKNSLGQESTYYPNNQYNFPTGGAASISLPTQSIIKSSKILISEIKNKGEKASDDYIELYNPNDFDVDIKGWQLKKRTSTGTESSIIVFDQGSIIKSKEYFVWVSTKDEYNKEINGQASSSSYLADNNSIALLDQDKLIIDALAWQDSINPFVEGNFFDKNHDINQSIGRKIKGAGPQYSDEDNNAIDFEIQNPTPNQDNQKYDNNDINQADVEENSLCNASNLVISEVKLGKTEYVEIFNDQEQTVNINDCYLGYFSFDSDWNNPTRLWKINTELSIGPRGHFLIGIYEDILDPVIFDWQVKNSAGNNYSSQQIAQKGAIGIFNCDPSAKENPSQARNCKIDAVGWESAIVKEDQVTQASQDDKSLARIISPDDIGKIGYQDTDNNEEDFEIQDPSPKEFSNHQFLDLDNDGLLDVKDINVTIGFNTFLESGEYIFKNLNIVNNSQLSMKGDCNNNLGVKIIVENLNIENGSSIAADNEGCANGIGAGTQGSGGGYGGMGAGDNSISSQDSIYGLGGIVYGDFFLPSDLGSDGGELNGSIGGKSGGSIIIEAKEKITVNGIISANAQNLLSGKAGGGSGGSIILDANTISGSGMVSANGGNSLSSGGGGGRIAIYYNSLDLPLENTEVYGGDGSNVFNGAAGSIFIKNKNQDRGELIIKNNGVINLTQTVIEDNLILKSLEIINGSRVLFNSDNIDSLDIKISSNSNLQFEEDVSIKTEDMDISSGGNIENIAQKIIGIRGGNITINSSSRITGNILMLADNLTISENAILSADNMGYSSDQGFGSGNLGSGGGYGGMGGGDEPEKNLSVYGEKGLSYGDFRLPSDFGSGGGSYSMTGGSGGGLIKLDVKNIIINGKISANGGVGFKNPNPYGGYGGGAGSGGGIVLKVINFSGSGEIISNGGSQNFSCGGGGGRIALYYTFKDGFSGKIQSYGGAGSGGSSMFKGDPGTIYLQQVDAEEGDLKFGEL